MKRKSGGYCSEDGEARERADDDDLGGDRERKRSLVRDIGERKSKPQRNEVLDLEMAQRCGRS